MQQNRYRLGFLFIVLIGVAINHNGVAQSKHSRTSAFPSYKGLIMAGYQGWFNAQEDGAGRGWNHYVAKGEFGPGNTKVDMWPETGEYEKVYKTPFVLADGNPAYLYSSYDASSADVHFRWMKEYGVDGVFVQRFVGQVRTPVNRHHNNRVLDNAMKASRKYGRAISVMYDLSGMRDSVDVPMLINDWKNLVDSLKITSQGNRQTYLYHNGKPLVVLWGVGFAGRNYTLRSIEKVIAFLKSDPAYGGCSIMLGVPTYWREFGRDADTNRYLHDVLRKVDIVHPWTIGRFNNEETYTKYRDVQKGDFAWCKRNKVDYVPVVFPGFSWSNMYPKSPFNQIPRNRGKFYWTQLTGAIQAGADMIYVAMFDEVDEGTAILKVSKKPPVGKSPFVTFEEDIPSDYYLYLTGVAGKMLRKQIPFQAQIPAPKPR